MAAIHVIDPLIRTDDGRIRVRLFALVTGLLTLMSGIGSAAEPELDRAVRSLDVEAGDVRFLNLANSSFDRWSYDPDENQKRFMRRHYRRMLTYPPYFDERLSWFPKAWAYLNTSGIVRSSSRVERHPDWILRDADGRRLYVRYACDGEQCPRYAADVGNRSFRRDWIERAKRRLAPGYRGLWMDDVNLRWRTSDGAGQTIVPIDPRTGNKMRLSDWRRYFAEFVEDVREELPDVELIHNVIWYADDERNEDRYITRQLKAADYINLERGVNDGGLRRSGRYSLDNFLRFVDHVHDSGSALAMMDFGDSISEREYGLAGYLLVSGSDDLYSADSREWTTYDNWWRGFDLDLGDAYGARYRWRSLWRRDFECGMVLLNGPQRGRREFALDEPLHDIAGERVTRVNLRARSATILLEDCATM